MPPRTMILLDPDLLDPDLLEPDSLDPDLDTDPASGARPAASKVVSDLHKVQGNNRLTSQRTLARFLAEARTAVRLRGEATVLLTTDATIRRLNRQFRGMDKATDVLSFPASGPGTEALAGDLAISVPTARRQAAAQGHALAMEIKILILHGLLHLSGYDHEADTGQMARRERLLRRRLGLPQGLIDRVAADRRETKKPGSGDKPARRRKP